MRINRPKIPTDVQRLGRIGYDASLGVELFPLYDYISSGSLRHGFPTRSYSADTAWYTVLEDASGSGVLRFCVFAADNNENATNTLSCRVTIDSVFVFDESLVIPANGGSGDFQGGMAAIGTIVTENSGTAPYHIRGASMGWLPYSSNLKIEMKTSDNVNMPIRCMYYYTVTG